MRSFLIAAALAASAVPMAEAGPQQSRTPAPPDEPAGYYFILGRHLEGEGRIDDAIAALRRASALEPNAAEPLAELSALYARQDRAREAVETAEAALQRDGSNREANRVLGTILAAYGEMKRPVRPSDDASQYTRRAIGALERARREGAFDVNVELLLGRLYLQTGNATDAITSLRRVVQDQPGYPDAALLLATAQESVGQSAEAVATLEATLEENPSYFRGRLKLAQLYDEAHRYRDAAAAYALAQAANPRIDLSSSRAAALINAGDAPGARRLLETSVSRGAPDAGALYLLAQAQRLMKDLPAAARTVDALKTAFPADSRGAYLSAKLLDDRGQRKEAVAAFEALIKQSPEEASLVYEYASLLEKSGRASDAERALRDLLSRDPLDANALNSLGYMFAERGERLDEAVSLLQRALKIEPENPSYLDSLGWAYFKQGRVDLADGPISAAAAKLPSSAEVQEHLGDLRFTQQRYAEAAAAWEKAIASDGEDIDRPALEKKLRDARERLKK